MHSTVAWQACEKSMCPETGAFLAVCNKSLCISISSSNNLKCLRNCSLLLQVRNSLVPAKRRAEAGQGTTWRALPQDDLKARLAASTVRRKAMTQVMPKDQWDLEKKYVYPHVTCYSSPVWPAACNVAESQSFGSPVSACTVCRKARLQAPLQAAAACWVLYCMNTCSSRLAMI